MCNSTSLIFGFIGILLLVQGYFHHHSNLIKKLENQLHEIKNNQIEQLENRLTLLSNDFQIQSNNTAKKKVTLQHLCWIACTTSSSCLGPSVKFVHQELPGCNNCIQKCQINLDIHTKQSAQEYCGMDGPCDKQCWDKYPPQEFDVQSRVDCIHQCKTVRDKCLHDF